MEVVFSAECIALFPDVLEDGAIGDIPENVDPDDVKIDRIVCVGVGESVIRTHLLVRSLFLSDEYVALILRRRSSLRMDPLPRTKPSPPSPPPTARTACLSACASSKLSLADYPSPSSAEHVQESTRATTSLLLVANSSRSLTLEPTPVSSSQVKTRSGFSLRIMDRRICTITARRTSTLSHPSLASSRARTL